MEKRRGEGLRVQIRGANNRGPVQSYFHRRVTSVNALAIVYATGEGGIYPRDDNF